MEVVTVAAASEIDFEAVQLKGDVVAEVDAVETTTT